MRKEIKSFTLDADVIKALVEYSEKHCWSASLSANKLLKEALGIKPPVVFHDNYEATPEEKAAADRHLASMIKAKEDVDFESSLRASL